MPSPNDQFQKVSVPVDVSVNDIEDPVQISPVSDGVKDITGGPYVTLTSCWAVVLQDPSASQAVRSSSHNPTPRAAVSGDVVPRVTGVSFPPWMLLEFVALKVRAITVGPVLVSVRVTDRGVYPLLLSLLNDTISGSIALLQVLLYSYV